MALKSLIVSGAAGNAIKEITQELAALANKYNAVDFTLDKFLELTKHKGCKVVETPLVVAALKSIMDSVPLPTDVEFSANSATSRFTADDCNAARRALKMAAGMQWISDKVAAQLPVNDV